MSHSPVLDRSITYDVGSKDESFEWMNVHRAPPTLVRPYLQCCLIGAQK